MMAQDSTSSQQRKSHDPLVDQSGFAVERLPMLGIVFEDMATAMVEGLRQLCRTPTSFSLDEIVAANLFETLAACKGSVAAVLHSAELDARALVIVDQGFVLSLIQILLGGDPNEPTPRGERPFTKIEKNLAQKIFEISAKSLQTAFEGVTEATFRLERQDTLADTSILGRRDAPVVVATLNFRALGVGGKMIVVIPQTALLPMRQKLAREIVSEGPAGDPRWAKQMQTGVSYAEISVKGVLEELPMTLGEIAALEVGHVLKLRGSGMGRVRLECGEHDLFWCQLSQVDGRYTLEVEEPILEERDILDDIQLS
jgi:flagellar motor switch protein FliM